MEHSIILTTQSQAQAVQFMIKAVTETFKHAIFHLWITLEALPRQGFQAAQLLTIHKLYKKIKKMIALLLANNAIICLDIKY